MANQLTSRNVANSSIPADVERKRSVSFSHLWACFAGPRTSTAKTETKTSQWHLFLNKSAISPRAMALSISVCVYV